MGLNPIPPDGKPIVNPPENPTGNFNEDLTKSLIQTRAEKANKIRSRATRFRRRGHTYPRRITES